MPAERAGYTVTMFLVDTSPSMGELRTVQLPPAPNGEERTTEITRLEWVLQFVKLKIQEMIYNGRKTDQCGVIVFGSEDTNNIINEQNGGYDNVFEYIPIAQPSAATLSKLDLLKATDNYGDPLDAIIVGVQTQATHLASKKTWTRKIVLVTDGESPIEVEDWEATVDKMNSLGVSITIVGVDFDSEDFGYIEDDKSKIKRANEAFYHEFISKTDHGVVGTCEEALQETARPDIKQTKSVLMGTLLRLGDVDTKPDEAIELTIKTSKCTAMSRPKSWKKFAMREAKPKEPSQDEDAEMDIDDDKAETAKVAYAQLKMRSEYYVEQGGETDAQSDVKMEDDDENLLGKGREKDKESRLPSEEERAPHLEKVEKEQLVRGFKYGTTYAPCPDGQFPRLDTRKGIDICGFFPAKNFRRELSMGEIQYVWADPGSAKQQAALSSIVQAMYEKDAMAIARWVTKDGMDPKMGVLAPVVWDEVDCLLWAQMPFADDVRKYTFASLDHLVNKKGETLTEHPFIPTEEQLDAMDNFVDAMDLMDAGEKDDEGLVSHLRNTNRALTLGIYRYRSPWFDTLESYNPSVHRTKQAMFHCAVTSDLSANPLPPPHPELLKYLDPPKRVLKRTRDSLEECKNTFKVKQVPKKVARTRKDGHAHAQDEDDMLLLEGKEPTLHQTMSEVQISQAPSLDKSKAKAGAGDSETEEEDEEDEEDLLLDKVQKPASTPPAASRDHQPLPTPARSMSPEVNPGRAPGRII
ncbi:hypothetical protein C0992_000501, partial [Termitomyces sp. T32_za158]